MCDRERNTKFYPTAVRGREASNAILKLYNADSVLVNGQEDIQKEAVDFYTALYNKDHKTSKGWDMIGELKRKKPEQNSYICKDVTEQEIKKAV